MAALQRRRGQHRDASSITDLDVESLLETLPLAALLLDPAGEATAVNAAWTAMSGLDRETSAGGGWLEAVGGEDRIRLRAALNAGIEAATPGTADARLTTADAPAWSRWWWRPHRTGGAIVCVANVNDDKLREADLWQRATHDPLTGLFNRAEFATLAERAIRRAERTGRPLAVLFVDLDGFKAVNDRGGHQRGDRVLAEIAQRLTAAVRPADVVARIGGDEFTVLCEDLDDHMDGHLVAERVRTQVRMPIDVCDVVFHVTATVGIAFADGDDANSLLARADAAMYAAKASGRPSMALSHPSPSPLSERAPSATMTVETALDWADEIVNQVFHVSFTIEAARSLVQGPARDRLDEAVDDLDGLVKDLRLTALALASGADAAAAHTGLDV